MALRIPRQVLQGYNWALVGLVPLDTLEESPFLSQPLGGFPRSQPQRPVTHRFLPVSILLLPSLGHGSYIKPTQKSQDNLRLSRILTTPARSLLPYKATYSHALKCRTWASLGASRQPVTSGTLCAHHRRLHLHERFGFGTKQEGRD